MKQYVLGASGSIGTVIVKQISESDFSRVPRNEYLSWTEEGRFEDFLSVEKVSEDDIFYYCSGVTDPSTDKTVISLVNCQIPLILLQYSLKIGYGVITFGSVLENSVLQNRYIDSKKSFLQSASSFRELKTHKHFQLHTVYGVHPPKPHMLMGKIQLALQSNSTLEMTSGRQLREYWHAEDVVKFIASRNIGGGWDRVNSVTSGYPVKLRDLALAIFKHFSAEELLKFGQLPDEPGEIYDYECFKQTKNAAMFMRNPIEGVISYLENSLTVRK